MLFSDSLPELLKEHSTTTQFVSVFDGLQGFKHEILAQYIGVDNFGTLMDEKWLRKKLEEYGVSPLPLGYPIQILRQYLLNADTVCGTRGSKIGLELYCSLMSFGEVTIDDSNFYRGVDFLMLDSLVQGHLTNDNEKNTFHLIDDTDDINPEVSLGVTIKSKFFNGKYPTEAELIKNHIKESLQSQVGFSPRLKITFKFQSRSEFYFHKLLNPYFV